MYRLLIIDDEIYTRQQIRNSINWELMNIEIVGEAHNGLNALELSDKLRPDIVIVDIKMPQMDGISFATEFSYRFPSSQLIFLSGYSDRNYMQNAIRLKAVDYIFKPFELSDLLSAIEKAIQRLNASSQNIKVPKEEDTALKLLLKSSAPDFQDYIKTLALPITFDSPFIVMLIRFNAGISFSRYESSNLMDSLELQNLTNNYYYAFQAEILQIFGDTVLMSKGGNSYVVFANIPSQQSDSSWEGKITSLLSVAPQLPITIGISHTYNTASSLNTAFREARQAAAGAFMTGYGNILFAAAAPGRQFSTEHEARSGYHENLEKQNISEASAALDDYFTYLSNCSSRFIPDIREDLLQLSLQLNKKLKNPPFQLISEFISQASTLEDIRQYMQRLLSLYLAEVEARDNHSRIIFEAEKYIINHLGEPLSVKQIADHVYVSFTYLCFLYKKQTGRTLNQFILDMRMKKARSLLLDTNLKIGDIAAALGYTNQNYFTKTFVSYYGTTPSKFRNHGE